MGKTKKIVRIVLWVILGLVILYFLISSLPILEGRTWTLLYAQRTQPHMQVVAHGGDLDASALDDPMYQSSKKIELTCKFKGGKLELLDKTNGKTYEGTYRSSSKAGNYKVVIDGKEGTANIDTSIPTAQMLRFFIDGYLLCFSLE